MTDENDPFGGGIELEFDAMEARRQAAVTGPADPDLAGLPPADDLPPLPRDDELPDPGFSGAQPDDISVPGMAPPRGGPASAPKQPGELTNFDYKAVSGEKQPPPLWRSIVGFLVIAALCGGFLAYWYRHDLFPEKASEIVARIAEGEEGEFIYAGETFQSTFLLDQEVEGTVRLVEAKYNPAVPYVTHRLVLASEDYLDPDRVELKGIDGYKLDFINKVDNPDGSMRLALVIPADATALEQINQIKSGQYVVLLGDRPDGNLTNADGSFTLREGQELTIIRVREVLFDEEPAAKK